jgi:hypothetical protein
LSILIIPLLGFSAKQIAGITVILIIIGEITFYLSLIFLGKSFYYKIKSRLKFKKSITNRGSTTGQPDEKITAAKTLHGQ